MRISILYDNQSRENRFQSGWGFSCLVDGRILFDTGEAPGSLFHNMDQMTVDPDKIEAVVISHDHWDHTGGLWKLLEKRKGLKVYACPGFSAEFKRRVLALEGTLIESDDFKEIDDRISVTGEIPGQYRGAFMPEQALIVRTEKGTSVITGCSHPGIITMIEKVKAIFPGTRISRVFGGFHLMDKNKQTIETIVATMIDMGVENVGPTHCTGQEAQTIFKNRYKDRCLSIRAGQTLEI